MKAYDTDYISGDWVGISPKIERVKICEIIFVHRSPVDSFVSYVVENGPTNRTYVEKLFEGTQFANDEEVKALMKETKQTFGEML